jgi:tellurite resistance protein
LTLSIQHALIHTMVVVSASDRDMGDAELARIGAIVRTLPVFTGFEHASTLEVAQDCQQRLQADGGFERLLDDIRDALSEGLRETAYALAVDVATVDRTLKPEEARILDIIRAHLGIERPAASAIERAAAIRHRIA